MLLFCPSCSNMLTITKVPGHHLSHGDGMQEGEHRFECRTCPYQLAINKRFYERKQMEKKVNEDILGGAASWQNVDRTEVKCANEKCDSRKAYFRQVQIRSADEPMTSFYKCCECATEWREN